MTIGSPLGSAMVPVDLSIEASTKRKGLKGKPARIASNQLLHRNGHHHFQENAIPEH